MVDPESQVQKLTDEFNKKYWNAANTSDLKDWFEACLLARQLVVNLGREGIVHDKMLDPEFKNKYTLEK